MKSKEYYRIIKDELWQGPKDKLVEYAAYGLAGEIGELAGQYAKFIRGDFDENELKRRLRKELGDCLWMWVAQYKTFPRMFAMDFDRIREEWALSMLSRRTRRHGDCMCMIANYVGIESYEELADENIAKLRDRKVRGVLKGDGDER